MGIKNIFNQKYISKAPSPKEEALHKRVLEELNSGNVRTGIMAKAMADSLGDKDKAESLYIKYRVQILRDETKHEAKLIAFEKQAAEEKRKKEKIEAELEKERQIAREYELALARKKEEWKNSKRYKLINFSWKAIVIYLVYIFVNHTVFESALPTLAFIDEFIYKSLCFLNWINFCR